MAEEPRVKVEPEGPSGLLRNPVVSTHRDDRDSIFSADLQPGFGLNSRPLPTKFSNILEGNVQKKAFVSSQVLALQIIHEHSFYRFSLVFLSLITHCWRKVALVDSHKLCCKHRGKRSSLDTVTHHELDFPL